MLVHVGEIAEAHTADRLGQSAAYPWHFGNRSSGRIDELDLFRQICDGGSQGRSNMQELTDSDETPHTSVGEKTVWEKERKKLVSNRSDVLTIVTSAEPSRTPDRAPGCERTLGTSGIEVRGVLLEWAYSGIFVTRGARGVQICKN